jgi:hypothetical protein
MARDMSRQATPNVDNSHSGLDETRSAEGISGDHCDTADEASLRAVKTQLEIDKIRLEIDKGSLEKQSLSRQLSWQSVALEWTKAGTVFVAVIGIGVTLWVGQQQARISRVAADEQSSNAAESRADDRFDKALTRLADRDNAGARLSGVAGLRLFLVDKNTTHQKEALHYLVTVIAEEKSPEVRRVILDAFADAGKFDQTAKDNALRTAIEIDRSLTEVVLNELAERKYDAERTLLARFLQKKKEDIAQSDITLTMAGQAVNGLTFVQVMEVRSIRFQRLFYDPNVTGLPPQPEAKILDDYVSLINLLLSGGARNVNGDWRGIYCQKCKFPASADMSHANFDGAFLSGADFSHVTLRGATFRNADLGDTDFFSSDLTGADLSWGNSDIAYHAVQSATRWRPFTTFPYLECATLIGANLNSLPLMRISQSFFGPSPDQAGGNLGVTVPSMTAVRFDDTTILKYVGFHAEWDAAWSYYDTLPTDRKGPFEKSVTGYRFSPPVPYLNFSVGGFNDGQISTAAGDKDLKFDFVRSNEYSSLDDLKSISEWARPIFTMALASPFWRAMAFAKGETLASEEPSDSAKQVEAVPAAPKKVDCSKSSSDTTLEFHYSEKLPH